jgi:hypothetical protein
MMDLVSVGFAKPESSAGRSMTCAADVVAAYRAFQRERPPVTDAVGGAPASAKSIGAGADAAAVPGAARPLALRAAAGAPAMGRLRSEALAEVAAQSPKAVTDRLQWASGRYAASWWTQVSKDEGRREEAGGRASARARQAPPPTPPPRPQFRVLFKRGVLAQLRNPTDATSRILLATWVGMLAGLAFFNLAPGPEAVEKRLALLFFTLLLFELLPFCYMSFYGGGRGGGGRGRGRAERAKRRARADPRPRPPPVEDRRFFAADVASDLYHPSAYYAATVTAGIPGVVINTLAGSLTAYGLAGLRAEWSAIALNSAIVCVQSLISIQLQVFCVWLTPNQDLAYVLATGYVAASILLSGFYLRSRDMQLTAMKGFRWVAATGGGGRALVWRFVAARARALTLPPSPSYLSYTKYAMEGVSQIELRGQTWDGCGGELGAAIKGATAGLDGLGSALGGGASAAPAPAPSAGTFAALLSNTASTVAAAPAAAAQAVVAAGGGAAAALRAYLRDHPDAAAMYNRDPARAQTYLAGHGYADAVAELRASGVTGPIDPYAADAPSAAAPDATPAAAAIAAPGGPPARRAFRGRPQAGDAAEDPFRKALGGSLADMQVASGGIFQGCDATGDSVLAFWGYKLTTGQVLGILLVFYAAFHVGSYLALSKLYRQKR